MTMTLHITRRERPHVTENEVFIHPGGLVAGLRPSRIVVDVESLRSRRDWEWLEEVIRFRGPLNAVITIEAGK